MQKYVLFFCNSVFPMWHFQIFIFFKYYLVRDLRRSQWWEFIMQCGLGYLIVWHKVVNVLEEHSRCIFTGRRKMEVVGPDQIPGPHQSHYTVQTKFQVPTNHITRSHNSEEYNFQS